MSGRGRSTASSRSRHLSPRLTVSAGSQSQHSAYTIYSNVESDHNVFAFVPPPVADGAQADEDLDQPPVEEDPRPATFRFPTTDSNRRRVLLSFGQLARRLDTGSEIPGQRTADSRVVAQTDRPGDRPEPPPAALRFDGGRGDTARTSDSDVFNFFVPVDDTPSMTRPVIVSDDVPSASSSGDRSGYESKENSIRYDVDSRLEYADEDSPFAEVRAAVSNIDDPTMPVNTFRVWFIGFFLVSLATTSNLYLSFRYPSIIFVAQPLALLAHPFGKFLALVLPHTVYQLPWWLGGKKLSLNPCPWNIKEHALIYMMTNVAPLPPYSMNVSVVAEKYYGVTYGPWFELLLVLSRDLTGIGLAGMCRGFSVKAASMIWPDNLVACTLLNALHAEEERETGEMSRLKLFLYLVAGSFLWYFIPGYLFTALSMFSWVCWIRPDNVVINQLFGVNTGLGMGLLTFDWAQISWVSNPLVTPWWAQLNFFAGFVFMYWILVPVFYYTNTWNFAHFPLNSNTAFDKFGKRYNVSRILTPQNSFDLAGYEEYSPLYLPATFAFAYFISFALSSCILVHTSLYHGRTILSIVLGRKAEEDDIHAKLMQGYPEVPTWFYICAGVLGFSLSMIATQAWHSSSPFWVPISSITLVAVYLLPCVMLFATTGYTIQVNLLAQIIPGVLAPGNPMANMFFKALAVETLNTTVGSVRNLKLGHYIKVPPRTIFWAQLVSAVLAGFLKVGFKQVLFHKYQDICTPNQPQHLTCPGSRIFFTSSIFWGIVGPGRQFGSGALYHPMLYAIVFGAFMPLPFWFWGKLHPNSVFAKISMPLWFSNSVPISPLSGISVSSSIIVGFIFQRVVRKRSFRWWAKFNYVTGAGLDAGTGFGAIVVFFALLLPKNGSISVDWWGNRVWTETADYTGVPYIPEPISS